ncbi:hypothetical protein [Polaribacter sp. Hel1_85]|uniref:hypothetical protein n=1 Tax=Polaribacter sp. Hel1_85 TaxID=1250005 RepID=UPI00052D1EA9|nr:hypothetical protein [Polaribacter sp. Hel1_85]KGL63583.1 hypothetical protein PHEL85_0620 [Polaribacter sp. Hel1_85]
MKRTKLTLFVLLLFLTTIIYSQNLNKLVENNGFRKIKLNTNVKDYVNEKGYYDFIKNTAKNSKYFRGFEDYNYLYATNDYKQIGNTSIIRIYVKTLNEIIYNVSIILDKKQEISDLTKLTYGKPTMGSSYNDSFNLTWLHKEKGISCNLIGSKGRYYYQLTYTNINLSNKAWVIKNEEKKKKAINQF